MPNDLQVKFTSNRAAVNSAVQAELRRKVTLMGFKGREVLTTRVLVGNRSGKWYKVPGTSKRYQASKPGEAPASRTGALRQSYTLSSVGGVPTAPSIRLGSNLQYAAWLENGTSRMAARPHLRPAIEAATPDFRAILGSDWRIQ